MKKVTEQRGLMTVIDYVPDEDKSAGDEGFPIGTEVMFGDVDGILRGTIIGEPYESSRDTMMQMVDMDGIKMGQDIDTMERV